MSAVSSVVWTVRVASGARLDGGGKLTVFGPVNLSLVHLRARTHSFSKE